MDIRDGADSRPSPFIPGDPKIVVGAVAPASPDPIPIVLLPGFEYRLRHPSWGCPSPDLTVEQDLIDLGWHHKEWPDWIILRVHRGQSRLRPGARLYLHRRGRQSWLRGGVCWWVRSDQLNTGLDQKLEATVRHWIAVDWPFTNVGYPGRPALG